MKKQVKTFNEMVLTILSENKGQGRTGFGIRNELYLNSIGGVKISGIELRNLIKKLRYGGHPIIAGPKGYKFADNEKELLQYSYARRKELEEELHILQCMEMRAIG